MCSKSSICCESAQVADSDAKPKEVEWKEEVDEQKAEVRPYHRVTTAVPLPPRTSADATIACWTTAFIGC